MNPLFKALLIPAFLFALACGGGGSTQDQNLPPSTLKWAVGADFNQIYLMWTPQGTPVNGYELEGSVGDGPFNKLHEGLLPGDKSILRIDFAPDTPELLDFSFRLRSVRKEVRSGYSNTVDYERGIIPAKMVTARLDDFITVSWQGGSLVAQGVRVERRLESGGGGSGTWETLASLSAQETSFTDTTIEEGKSYFYQITYFTATKFSKPIESNIQRVDIFPPEALVTNSIEKGVQLNWKNRSKIATELIIYRKSINPPPPPFTEPTEIVRLAPNVNSFSDNGLSDGLYYYVLKVNSTPNISNNSKLVYGTPLPHSDFLNLDSQVILVPFETTAVARRPQEGWVLGETYQTFTPKIMAFPGVWPEWSPATFRAIWTRPFVKLDSRGFPHAVVLRPLSSDSHPVWSILHIWFDGDGWRSEELAQRVFQFGFPIDDQAGVDFAIDSHDELHFAWNSSGTALGGFEYLHRVNGAWVIEALNSSPDGLFVRGTYRLVLDSLDNPHIFAGTDLGLVEFTRIPSGTWSHATLPTGPVKTYWNDTLEVAIAGPDTSAVLFQRAYTPSDPAAPLEYFCIRKNQGAWQFPEKIAPEAGTDPQRLGVALSRDGSRLAIFTTTQANTRVMTLGISGWQETQLHISRSRSAFHPPFGFTETNKLFLLRTLATDAYSAICTLVIERP